MNRNEFTLAHGWSSEYTGRIGSRRGAVRRLLAPPYYFVRSALGASQTVMLRAVSAVRADIVVVERNMANMLDSDLGACSDGPIVRIQQRDKHQSVVDHAIAADLSPEIFADSLPIRTVKQRSNAKFYTGKYMAYTVGTFVQFESILELRRAQVADSDPAVSDIRSQPFRLVGKSGRLRRYTPDYALVDVKGGVTIVEVKTPHAFADPRVKETLAWAEQLFRLCGWRFERWSAGPLEPISVNMRYLESFHDPRLIPPCVAALVLGLVERCPCSIDDLEAVVTANCPQCSVLPAIKHLLWNQQLRVDLWSSKIEGEMVVNLGCSTAPDYLDPRVLNRRRYELIDVVL